MKQKILLVEDEHSIADSISYNLKQEGFSVTHVDEGPIALELFQEEEFSLIILDLMLPAGIQTRFDTLDVQKLLGTQIATKTRFGDRPVCQMH